VGEYLADPVLCKDIEERFRQKRFRPDLNVVAGILWYGRKEVVKFVCQFLWRRAVLLSLVFLLENKAVKPGSRNP